MKRETEREREFTAVFRSDGGREKESGERWSESKVRMMELDVYLNLNIKKNL